MISLADEPLIKVLPIEPYTQYSIDCTQNLYISLLRYYQYDIRLLGACWPWEFVLFSKDNESIAHQYKIINARLTSEERLKKLFQVDLVYHKFDNISDMWLGMKSLLESGTALVVGLERFNEPYRENETANLREFEHTIMLLGEDQKEKKIHFIDTMPKHVGVILEEDLLNSLKSNKHRLWYSEIIRGPSFYQIGIKELWDYFIGHIRRIEDQYQSPRQFEFVYTDYFIHTLSQLLQNNQKKDLVKELSELCAGLWGWEIDRKSKWLICYLEMMTSMNVFPYAQECVNLIKENDYNWNLTFRFLFMASRGSPPKALVEKAIDKLKIIRETDLNLFRIIK